jgi:hypothetical protein
LLNAYNSFTLESSISVLEDSYYFGTLYGFGLVSSNISSYYITDRLYNYILIFDDQWNYVNYENFISPTYITSVGSSLYISGANNMWKTDQNLNILAQYSTNNNPFYQGIYYNSTSRYIFAAANKKSSIHVFDLNLNYVESFSTQSYYPWSIAGFNNRMYIGCLSLGTILVIVNRNIIATLNGCNGKYDDVTSIIFDQSGYMATSCSINGYLYLYNNYSIYGGFDISNANPMSIGFDSRGRFVVVSKKEISFYYYSGYL